MTMYKSIIRLLSAVFIFSATLDANRSEVPQTEADSVVRQFESAFVSAYNRGDSKTVAGMYTEGATVLGEYGAIANGRTRIERILAAAFAQAMRPKIDDAPEYSATISHDVIVTHGISHVTPADTSRPPVDALYTKVLIREGGQWRIAAAQYAQPNPWTVNFAATTVGETSAPQTLRVTNIGTNKLNMRQITLWAKEPSDFGETNTCSGSIPPSGSCTLTFTFTPKQKGRRTAELSFWDDAATGRHAVKLIGFGK